MAADGSVPVAGPLGMTAFATDLNEELAAKASSPASTTDNRLVRTDGTTGDVQESGVTLDDTDNMSGLTSLAISDANFNFQVISNQPHWIADTGNDRIRFIRSSNAWNHEVSGIGTLQIESTRAILARPIRLASFTVATLPTGTDGDHAFASDLRNGAEGAGVGTGGPVYFANSNWRRYEDNAVATA